MEGGAPRAGYSLAEATIWYGYCSYNPLRYVDPDGRLNVCILPTMSVSFYQSNTLIRFFPLGGGYTNVEEDIHKISKGINLLVGIIGCGTKGTKLGETLDIVSENIDRFGTLNKEGLKGVMSLVGEEIVGRLQEAIPGADIASLVLDYAKWLSQEDGAPHGDSLKSVTDFAKAVERDQEFLKDLDSYLQGLGLGGLAFTYENGFIMHADLLWGTTGDMEMTEEEILRILWEFKTQYGYQDVAVE